MHSYFALVAALLSSGVDAAAVSPSSSQISQALTQAKSQYKWGDDSLSFPNSEAFKSATERWTTYQEPQYLAAFTPDTDRQVAQAVKVATSFSIPFLATGGRHGFGSMGDLKNGLAINLAKLDGVEVDAAAGTLTIGGGVTFAQIYEAVGKAGYMIQTGSCSCPGMMGVTLGGGVGRWEGLFGLIIDDLISVRMVTADGRLTKASKDTNPELFWGLRGAGHNFGVITSATFRLHKQVNHGSLTSVDFIFPASVNGSYFEALASMQDTMPKELGVISVVVYNSTSGEPEILTNWMYAGPEAKAREVMAPIFALESVRSEVVVTPWSVATGVAGFGQDPLTCQKGVQRSGFSALAKNYSAPTWTSMFNQLADFYTAHPDARGSSLELEAFPNQAMSAVPDDSTAYPWRDTLGYLLISMSFSTGDTEKAANDFARGLRSEFAETSGYDDLAIYVNYARGDEKLEQIYTPRKLGRLAKLKKKWDPHNVFKYKNAIPTKYP